MLYESKKCQYWFCHYTYTYIFCYTCSLNSVFLKCSLLYLHLEKHVLCAYFLFSFQGNLKKCPLMSPFLCDPRKASNFSALI